MNPNDMERLLDTNFRFVSWLRNHFPEVKDQVLEDASGYLFCSYGELIRKVPTLFWSFVGNRDYEVLARKSESGESILDRVTEIIRTAPPAVRNEVVVGFVEGHMFPRPNSPLALEMRKALGPDIGLGDVF